ncbi:hypothetical protein Tco_0166586, partial [Tanacetum coccineum]
MSKILTTSINYCNCIQHTESEASAVKKQVLGNIISDAYKQLAESTQQEMPLQTIPDEEQSISKSLVATPLDLPFGTRRTSICMNTSHWKNQ